MSPGRPAPRVAVVRDWLRRRAPAAVSSSRFTLDSRKRCLHDAVKTLPQCFVRAAQSRNDFAGPLEVLGLAVIWPVGRSLGVAGRHRPGDSDAGTGGEGRGDEVCLLSDTRIRAAAGAPREVGCVQSGTLRVTNDRPALVSRPGGVGWRGSNG